MNIFINMCAYVWVCVCMRIWQSIKQTKTVLGKGFWVLQAPCFDSGNCTVLCSIPSCMAGSIIHAVHRKRGSERKREKEWEEKEGGLEEGEAET